MAQLVVQSRFAGLKIEDDDYPPTENQKSKKSKVNNTKKTEPPKKQKNVTNKPQPGPKKKKSKPQQVSADQWELWKQKDEEMVVGHFEDELQQAILLSKLDFEKEEGRVYLQTKENAELEETINELSKQEAKKLKKKNVMSLDQFNDMMNAGEELKLPPHANEKCVQEVPKSPIKDPGFFDRVKAETKKELLKEKVVDKPRAQPPISNEVITRLQFTDALDRKDQEIATLKEEVENLKHELFTVKCRNKKLCNILGQGEMKDKAEVLIEVERLRSVQAELTAELASLHTDLEKERSKNTDPRAHKDKINVDAAQSDSEAKFKYLRRSIRDRRKNKLCQSRRQQRAALAHACSVIYSIMAEFHMAQVIATRDTARIMFLYFNGLNKTLSYILLLRKTTLAVLIFVF